MRLTFILLVLFSLPATAQNASTGSNSESDFKTEERTGISRERSMDASKSNRSEESRSEEDTLTIDQSKEKSTSTQESFSEGSQYVTEYGIEPVKIVTGIVRDMESELYHSDSPLVRQIKACGVFTNPCVPTMSFAANLGEYDPYQNKILSKDHDKGMACNQFHRSDMFGEWHNREVEPNDLITRTAACYALISYTILEVIDGIENRGKIELEDTENFVDKAKLSLNYVIKNRPAEIMIKALEFGDSFIGAACRIPTSYGYGPRGIHEWYCAGLKINAREVTATYQGMNMIGGPDILGQTYVVQRKLDTGYQVASETAKRQSETTSETLASTKGKTVATSSENNVSMRRSSTSEQGSTVTTGVSTRNDATAASQK